ncbi:PD-(D/E)XK nuclease family protein [uncultured Gemmiger sp.]|uniref:PD-(D/E)XK nuclease family protein n=1 Tax=uncultured Gemmiger sp. TaxID=1623490 RepID=UPI0025E3DC93|nr:PD-(D/E)XK nuclease family protein [uncultured Gemmiger sp.]
MLTLLLGTSGSGKSYRMLAELRARAERGEHSLLIVPEQFTSSTEGLLYRTLGDSLSAYVESYSFTSLAETILRRYGGAAVQTLDEAGRALLVRRAVDSLLDKVVYYSRQRKSAAFCEKAAQTIGEMKSAGITPDALAAYAAVPGMDQEKIDELALIYGAYESLLGQSVMDPTDRQQLAAERLQPDFFAGRAVFVDEFDTFNAPKRALLAAMLPTADVTVCLCCDGETDPDHGLGLFSGAKKVAATLRRMAADAGVDVHTEILRDDLRHADAPALAELNLLLADPTYTPEPLPADAPAQITYCAAPTRQAEAKAVAAEIAARARQGTPYHRMAVICRDTTRYLAALRYEFRLQNIPLFCDDATTPENTAPAQAVFAALDILRMGLGSRTVQRLIKTGLVHLPERVLCALENYTYTWGLSAEDWRRPFTRSAAGYDGMETEQEQQVLADAETARAAIVPTAQEFAAKAKGASAAELTKQIFIFLQALGAEDSLNELAADLRAAGRLPEADEALREWNVVMRLLNQLALLLGDEVFAPADYAELFTLLLRTTDMGHIPQSLDSVIVTSAGRMRLPETDAVFVVGLTEGEFPQTPGDRGLLNHADRDIMMREGADLPDCFENKLLREGICFYKALTVARRYLWLSWPAAAHGQDTAPASAALLPVLTLLQVPPYTPSAADMAAAPTAALDLYSSLCQQPEQGGVCAAILQVLKETPAATHGFDAVHRAIGAGGFTVVDTAALETVLGKSLRVSPTKFERYQLCPFSYFMQYVLGAAPRKKAELAPNISGTLTHWVLENALRRQGEGFTELSAEELETLVDALVQEYIDANLPGMTVRMQYLVQRIRRNLVGLLGFLQRDFRQSGFKPVAFELRINDRDDGTPTVPPVELEAMGGHTVRVVGTVDRVDAMQLGETTYLRVVDYKTGGKNFALKEVYCGLDCQMLIYLFTLERNAGNLFPNAQAAGIEYLLADPAQESITRTEADEQDGSLLPTYPMNGLLLDNESVYRAMDTRATGEFAPINFSAKTGKPLNAKNSLADRDKLDKIRAHLDTLLTAMADDLYGGKVDALPLGGAKSPCQYCDFRAVCGHTDGQNEREPKIPQDLFE